MKQSPRGKTRLHENREFIFIREERATDGKRSYLYRLTMRESTQVASFKLPLYSITVELTDVDGKVTEAKLNDAFSDVGKAIVFFNKLVKHLVTPIDLAYVFEDELVK